jgi:DnaJ family protein C protein 9
MSAATIIEQAFGPDSNLYTAVLNMRNQGPSVTASQLRKAYYRQALKYHPDKQADKSEEEAKVAKLRFQAISVAYSILSDVERRQLYDENGEMDDTDEMDQTNTDAWKDYFKGIFGKVTANDIDRFAESYKCSEEEEKDVLKYYTQFEGDLNKMLECVMCSDDIDKKRWVEDYINPAIQNKKVKEFVGTMNRSLCGDCSDGGSTSREDEDETETEDDSDEGKIGRVKKRKFASKAKTSKKTKKIKKKEPAISDDLVAAIRGRSGTSFAELEERYSPKSKKGSKKKKAAMDDIPDDEFDRIQKRLDAQRKSQK